MRRPLGVVWVVLAAGPLAACSSILGFQDVSLESAEGGSPPEGDGGTDASGGDGAGGDAATGGGMEGGGSDGSAAAQTLVMGLDVPGAIAIDATYVYYAVIYANQIWRMNKDGSDLVEAANGDFVLGPTGVASDGTSFYFTNSSSTSPNVYACPAAGCATHDTVIATTLDPEGITVSNGTLFWTGNGTGNADGTVTSASATDGSGSRTLFTATDDSSPDAIAVDGTNVYFTDNTNGSLRRVQADGTGLTDLTMGNEPSSSLKVAIGTASIFFTTGVAGGGPGAVWSIAKASGAVNSGFATNQASCRGIATDAMSVYWVDQGDLSTANGTVMMCPQAGCPSSGPTQLAGGQAAPYGIAVDDSYVYWTNGGVSVNGTDGSVMRLAKP
jgi:hypothetical protein